uniref:Uncharacterized protein n=1 Tax=Glycine max TaxID=3847 RepID=A0A0R0KSA1_SOYBN
MRVKIITKNGICKSKAVDNNCTTICWSNNFLVFQKIIVESSNIYSYVYVTGAKWSQPPYGAIKNLYTEVLSSSRTMSNISHY